MKPFHHVVSTNVTAPPTPLVEVDASQSSQVEDAVPAEEGSGAPVQALLLAPYVPSACCQMPLCNGLPAASVAPEATTMPSDGRR